MGQAISMAAVYCCCSASSSLCQSCFGSVAIGTTGRKRSVVLLTVVIAAALWFQYSLGPAIVAQSGWIGTFTKWMPFVGNTIENAWLEPCLRELKDATMEELQECAGNAGVYRPTALSTLFFVANAVATRMAPVLNREAWPAKYALFGFGLLLSIFLPSDPLFSSIYLWVARFGAAFFVVLQQVILIDVAYNWNDDWVEKANASDRLSFGSGSGWLHAIVGICVVLYTACVGILGLLYAQYTGDSDGGCAGNTWVIILTLLGIIGVTALQLLATEGGGGSLLTSGVISLYALYLCFSIVSKNPSGRCNPRLGDNDVWGITIGLVLTTVSLVWTGWSWSAEPRLMTAGSLQSAGAVTTSDYTVSGIGGSDGDLDLGVPFVDGTEQATTGTVTTTTTSNARESAALAHVWKLNLVLALVSCYVAMILTGWGTLHTMVSGGGDNDNDDSDSYHNAANPTVGRANMAILGIAQWLALMLYAWTLVAPLLFPDRDFS